MQTSKLLFYLDDDVDDLNYFKHIISDLGHRTEIFMTGNELLYALKHEVEKPDIIFLDVHMPILNGEEILSIIKKSEDYKYIPIVMISGAFPKKLARDYQKMGVDYLMKKSVGSDLKASLMQVLEFRFPLTA